MLQRLILWLVLLLLVVGAKVRSCLQGDFPTATCRQFLAFLEARLFHFLALIVAIEAEKWAGIRIAEVAHVIAFDWSHLWGRLHQLSLLLRDLIGSVLREKGNLLRIHHLNHLLLLHFLVFQSIFSLLYRSLDDFLLLLSRIARLISRNGRVVCL